MRLFRHYGCKSFDSEKFDTVKNRPHWCKPTGGLWSSPVDKNEIDGWAEWCRNEEFNINCLKEYFDFTLREDARIAVINTLHDLEVLIYKYAQELEDGITVKSRVLDFERMCDVYDAIELTSPGQQDTRFTNPDLYGWDCHSLLVLNPNVVVPVVNGEHT